MSRIRFPAISALLLLCMPLKGWAEDNTSDTLPDRNMSVAALLSQNELAAYNRRQSSATLALRHRIAGVLSADLAYAYQQRDYHTPSSSDDSQAILHTVSLGLPVEVSGGRRYQIMVQPALLLSSGNQRYVYKQIDAGSEGGSINRDRIRGLGTRLSAEFEYFPAVESPLSIGFSVGAEYRYEKSRHTFEQFVRYTDNSGRPDVYEKSPAQFDTKREWNTYTAFLILRYYLY